jgi:hypothetical protein
MWRITLSGVGIVAALTLIGALLLASGLADPPVAGPVSWSDRAFSWANGPEIGLGVGESAWFAAPESASLPAGKFTLSVAASITPDSDPGTAWGIWIETESGDRVVYAISGEGYTTTRLCERGSQGEIEIEDCPALRPEWRWMPYPRIQPPGATNTITLHRETTADGRSEVRLRINREIMGAAEIAWSGRWGVWLRGGRAAGASGLAGAIRWIDAELRR